MFDDIFRRDWELALLIYRQSKLLNQQGALSAEEERLFRVQAKRIKQLLEQVSGELPNWQKPVPVNAGEGRSRKN
jgi:hypothetical protein